MRRPRPPASTTPVTGVVSIARTGDVLHPDGRPQARPDRVRRSSLGPVTPALLCQHRWTDALHKAVIASEQQVVFVHRAPEHGDADLGGDLVAHLGEAGA